MDNSDTINPGNTHRMCLTLSCKKGTEKCNVNLKTRKKCPNCRLNKCLAIGMKKYQGNRFTELIMAMDLIKVVPAKYISEFVLLKHGALELHYLRCCTYWNYDKQSWVVSMLMYKDDHNAMNLSMDFVQSIQPDNKTHALFRDYVNDMFIEINHDFNIINLMTAIIMFNPYRKGLKYKHVVKLQQQIYMHLLRRYLLVKYQCEGKASDKYRRLMNTLTDLYYLEMSYKQITLNRVEGVILDNTPVGEHLPCDQLKGRVRPFRLSATRADAYKSYII
ncbi:unnamed protein product [Oppiella nova]|uniref:Nuclear receptor domain-containing protein n=1 Tax=Oppiella nova TaxID=334625 RepID=A0A7R9QTP5_9ACAR|nr:unnamed protein product [Oppiella nova]CAG2173626.1 unnamed protein product [Oppiella nova]